MGRGRDDLSDCLLLLAGQHGKSTTRDALTAGLPLQGPLTPALFARAAERAGFLARVAETPLTSLNPALLPAILLLRDERACVVYAVDRERGTASVAFPELGSGEQGVDTPLAELEPRYLGQ